MKIDVAFNDVLSKIPNITSLVNTEDSLLSLAASDVVDSIYYCNILKFSVDKAEFFINRYFEFGAFRGFSENKLGELVQSELLTENLLPVAVYTMVDVDKKKIRDASLFANRRKGKHLLHRLSLL